MELTALASPLSKDRAPCAAVFAPRAGALNANLPLYPITGSPRITQDRNAWRWSGI